MKLTIPAIFGIIGAAASIGCLMVWCAIQDHQIAKLEARVHQLTEMVAPNLLIGESK